MVARGRTVKIARFTGVEELVKHIGEHDSLTGRIIVSARLSDGSTAESVLLLQGGKVVAASLNGGKAGVEDIVKTLANVEEGFVEVQELDKAGVELDLEFNSGFRVEGEHSLARIVDQLRRVAAEAKPAPEAAEERIEAKPVKAEAAEAGVETKPAEERGELAVERPMAEAIVEKEEARNEAVAEKVEAATEGEAVTAEAIVEERESVEAAARPETGVKGAEAAMEERVETEAKPLEAAEVKVEAAAEAKPAPPKPAVEERVVEEARQALEKLPEEVRSLVEPRVFEEVSKIYASEVINVYLVAARNGHVVKVFRDVGPEEAIKELMSASAEGYARLLASFDNQVEAYIIAYKGFLCGAAITPYLQPITILESGVKALIKFFEEARRAKLRRYVVMVLPEEDVEPILGCGEYVEELKKLREEREKKARVEEKKRRGFLRFLFGR